MESLGIVHLDSVNIWHLWRFVILVASHRVECSGDASEHFSYVGGLCLYSENTPKPSHNGLEVRCHA